MKKSSYCCNKMQQECKDILEVDELKDHSILSRIRGREYCIYFKEETAQNDPDRGMMLTNIYYCPFCGTYLGKQLFNEWYDTLEKEYGIISPRHNERDKVPPEFWTDEWWKKRGL